MSSGLEELHAMLREGFIRYGRERYSFQQRCAALASAEGFSAETWRECAELGWLALRLPEARGGLNADAAMIGSLMETVGRHLLLEPFLASAVLGTGAILMADAELQSEILPRLADGSLKLAFAQVGLVELRENHISGSKIGVLHGDVADHFIVSVDGDEGGLYLVDGAAHGTTRKPYRLIDGRGAAIVSFANTPVRRIGDRQALQHLADQNTVALCAEMMGCSDHLVEATAAYLKVRKQFGRTLGSYQALQHRMSEMALLREEIRALTMAAQAALDGPEASRARSISGAAAYIISAARTIGNEAVQLHGGIGVTEELDISHHFRRLMVATALLGGRDMHIERFDRSPDKPVGLEQA